MEHLYGHDVAEDPHVQCREEGGVLTCIYGRHMVTERPGRPGRNGYADKGLYSFACREQNVPGLAVLSGLGRLFTTKICRIGTGTWRRFQCWTPERREKFQRERALEQPFTSIQTPVELEQTTQEYEFQGRAMQETLLKFLVNPQAAGRRFFLDSNDDITARDIGNYIRRCEVNVEGGLTLQEISSLLPLLLLGTDP